MDGGDSHRIRDGEDGASLKSQVSGVLHLARQANSTKNAYSTTLVTTYASGKIISLPELHP